MSVWTHVLEVEKTGLGSYTNPFYQPAKGLLTPLVSSKSLGIWKDLYLKFNPAYRPPESVIKRARQLLRPEQKCNGVGGEDHK